MSAFPLTLNTRVKIERRVEGSNAVGDPSKDWLFVADAWASVMTARGMEAIRAGTMASTVNTSIRLRYRLDIDAGMRVIVGATVYQIVAVLPDTVRRIHCDLVCEVIK